MTCFKSGASFLLQCHVETIPRGDFLLIVLKNLIEKQSDIAGQKLKVVLMFFLT
ncbi:unnamed protein product [Musa acuminata subsp. malaccensis]|uniref:(wild Malaysian banana) hypothetical protein n=1 Tax=Musa acuminata subsp. malaccensis TaxID=214687 RepID=A0A804K785_MUSAM|nr:unnamed protein product [Musa acuminata subsp. malaccensis]